MMDTNEVSSILVDLDGGEFGIVTDRDLRSGVVAGRLSPDDRVTALMSTPLISVSADQTGADVMLAMLDHDIRHIPVFASRSNLLGVIVGIDLVAAETRSPFVLRRAIARARDKAELREAASRLRSTVVALHRAGLTPLHVSDVVSAVTDALIRRMIDLAIETEGPPPTQFTWMSLGSHGRREPVPSSDLDSGMAWLDRPDPDPIAAEPRRRLASARTAEYMRSIASHVADCEGDRLAPRSARRHPLGVVRRELDRGLAPKHRGLAHPAERQQGADRHLDPARRPRGLRTRARARRQAAPLRARGPSEPRELDAEAGARREASDGLRAEHRRLRLGQTA